MMSGCPKCRKMSLDTNSAPNASSVMITWITILMIVISLNLVTSRRIIPTDGDIVEFSLGDKVHKTGKVPVYSKVQLKCLLHNPIWYKNGVKLSVEMRRMKTITFEKIKKTDAGVYSCESDGSQKSTLTLSVLPGGEVKSNFAGNMEIYSQVSERIDEQQNHNESDYYYEKEAEENVDLDNEEITENSPNEDVHLESNIEGSAPMWKDPSTLLRTLPKPSGSYIRIPCLATGTPTPNITWTKDDKAIVRTMGKVLYRKWAIRMEDAIPEDSGQYKCTVCNAYGCIEHTTKLIIQDRVNHKPIVLTRPKNLTLTVGGVGEFKCAFLSDLTHVIAWTFKPCHSSLCPENKNASVLKSDPERSDVLKLENVTHDQEGWYTCIAANSLGTSAASAYLHVVDELYEDSYQNAPPLRSHPFWIIIVTVITGFLFLIGCAFILFISRKLKQEKLMKHRVETVHQWTKKVIIYKPSPDPGSPETIIMPIIKIEKQRTTLLQNSNSDPAPFNEYEFPLDSSWEIPRKQLILGDVLGEGAFGRVVKAEAIGMGKNQDSCTVAVKMVKEGHTDADIASLVREMEVMKMIGKHINIIELLGCCTQDGPLYVIVEFAPHDNLRVFLMNNKPKDLGDLKSEDPNKKPITQKHLISFAFQVARGMEYLASRRYIHRDLAARNVLVFDDYVVKIADFGLARDIQSTDYYRKNTNGRLPIKWMAPESLQEKFYDSQSDVWSYGILLWEIMAFGEQPYQHLHSPDEVYNFLMSGQRLEKPSRCSLNIYTLMRQCWNLHPHERPTFSELVESLDITLSSIANADEEYLDLEISPQLQLQIETPPSSDDEMDVVDTRYKYLFNHTTLMPLLRNGK